MPSTRETWHIGNTTVRTPYRLREGLRVLAGSHLAGHLVGRERETEFARLLHDAGVVAVDRIVNDAGDDYSDVGRKWRAALMQLGFITPKFSNLLDSQGVDPDLVPCVYEFENLAGRPYEMTPNGERLIGAETLAQQQECFLRSILAYRLPSPIEGGFSPPVFSPLRIVLSCMAQLSEEGEQASISVEEMATVVQFVKDEGTVADATQTIARHRNERRTATDKALFDRTFRASQTGREGAGLRTLFDYADLNFRYLKATGLFNTRGRSIVPAPDKLRLVEQIMASPLVTMDDKAYFSTLWKGAELPTDRREEAIEVIDSLADLLAAEGSPPTLPNLEGKAPADLAQIRLGLEDEWQQLQERAYAARQAEEWRDIIEYMDALAGKSKTTLVPRGEAAAYLEWTIWRAFLAVDSLVGEPCESRRFRVDQDFLPVSTAPGNGPDMLFDFDDYVLVVEVTLTASSRQEAAEGEPVRRHVASIVEQYEAAGKPVYGLFIANAIDSNTAETFRLGAWYKPDDGRLALQIVPLTLADFAALFEAGFEAGGLAPRTVEQVIRDCRVPSNEQAPRWKQLIGEEIGRHAARLMSS